MSETPEPDRLPGAPHPRETPRLYGHDRAEQAFLSALSAGRMAHAWLLAGPRGIGKASFAYRAAAAVLSNAASTLTHGEDNPVHRRIAAGNEPRLMRLIRTPNEKTGKLRAQISVTEVRAVKAALNMADPEGGWRAVIVDSVDDANAAAANALLKTLEEPPAKVVFFLVSHAPGRLLPTIRSRCRRLDFQPLDDAALATAYEAASGEPADPAVIRAARGSAGAALVLSAQDGAALQDGIASVLAPLPVAIDRDALHKLADRTAGSGQEDAFRAAAALLTEWTAQLAAAAAGADNPPPGSGPLVTRPAPVWAETAAALTETADRTLALNLDRRQALLDMFARIERAAKGVA